MSDLVFVDTHCHLDFPEFDSDRDEVIKKAKNAGLGCIINIGSSLANSRMSLELSRKYDFIYAAAGVHPHEADRFDEKEEAAIRDLAKQKKIVAIGETGLDYFKNYSKPDSQRKLFLSLLKIAKDFSLPLVIHTRDAKEDTLKILKEAMPVKAVLHCFSGDREFLEGCLKLGFFISFTCNITYKKAENLRAIVKLAPLERLMLETDAPFLAPEGLRGKRNEPQNVKLLAEEIAGLKQIELKEVARVTTANALSFFNIQDLVL